MIRHRTAALAALALVFLSRPADAALVDGTLDAEYGPAVVVQSVQTGLGSGQITGDNNRGELDFANGSELDAAHAFLSGGALHLFLAGNLALVLNNNQNGTVRHVLDVFVDATPGGQGVLNGLGAGNPLNGMAFDAGFEADYWFELEGDNNGIQGPRLWEARRGTIDTGSGGSLASLGFGTAGGPGTLAGGTNPFGIRATIDNRNVAGVTSGCNASSGAGVATGIEWEIPLAAIGNPDGCVRILAFVRTTAGSVSNQVLAPLPVGTCPPGSASFLNFASFAGDQFFTVCPSATGVPGRGTAGLSLAPAAANPSRDGALRVVFTLPDDRPARLRLVDAAGRVLREHVAQGPAGAWLAADPAAGPRLAPGVYWVRLDQGDASVARKFTVTR